MGGLTRGDVMWLTIGVDVQYERGDLLARGGGARRRSAGGEEWIQTEDRDGVGKADIDIK